MHQQGSTIEETSNSENSLINIIPRYITHWRWFVLGIIVAAAAAFFYIRYQAPMYQVDATILIKDDKKGGVLSELSAFQDLGILNKTNNIDNEIEILKSRSLMTLVARELRLNVRYFVERSPLDVEKFRNSPIYLRFVNGEDAVDTLKSEFIITPKSATEFHLADKAGRKHGGVYKFGQEYKTKYGQLAVHLTATLTPNLINKEVRIIITPIEKVVDDYRREIKIEPISKTSNVIVLSLKDPVKEKAAAIVDNLIKQHNADAIADKNLVSKNTANFIHERIQFITAELSDVESEVEDFKTKHNLVDVESEAKLFLESGNQNEINILKASTQKVLADYMYDYILKHDSPDELVPANLGLTEKSVGDMIAEYNRMVLERNRFLKNSSEMNPIVVNMDAQLAGIRKNLRESLKNFQTALSIEITELNRAESGIISKIATVPKYEREFRMIQRQQQIKETLYLYLLQKREETNIALAVTVANAKVIDKAYSNGKPVSPKKKNVYIIAILVGLFTPIIILYIRDILDNKVHGKRDIDRIAVPFLGDIPVTASKEKIVVAKGENSSVAEAFRLLRTNINFILGTKIPGHGRTIFLTSTLSKEGKSFIAINLASSIAISGKKVLLIGMDVRAPKVLQYFNMEERQGLTNYVSDHDMNLDDVIIKTSGIDHLHILPSGTIPPNPAELLMNERIKGLFDIVKERYDYVIVDTAPIGMVTDTLLISDYADAFIFVVRAYYLDKRLLSVAEDLYKEKRLPNMAILINGTDKEKGYGYGYGYGYGGYGYGHEKQRPLWKKLIRAN